MLPRATGLHYYVNYIRYNTVQISVHTPFSYILRYLPSFMIFDLQPCAQVRAEVSTAHAFVWRTFCLTTDCGRRRHRTFIAFNLILNTLSAGGLARHSGLKPPHLSPLVLPRLLTYMLYLGIGRHL